MNSADTGMSRKAQAMLKKRAAAKEREEKRQAAIARGENPDAVKTIERASNTLYSLIDKLPKPANPDDPSTFFHKNGFGLKFYRKLWNRYPEPCYWTITRFKPSQHGHRPRAWGIFTWRGVSEDRPRKIPGSHKREWRFFREIQEDGSVYPPYHFDADTKVSKPSGITTKFSNELKLAPKIKGTRSKLFEKQEREKAKLEAQKNATQPHTQSASA